MPNDPPRIHTARERLDELYRRLARLPRADSADAALRQICETLDQVEDDFEPAAEQLRKLVADNGGNGATSQAAMNLVVIQVRDLEAVRNFYRTLGLSFTSEQHGSGPRHYATILGPLVFEIYPCCGDGRPSPMRIGFRVPSVDWTVEMLRQQGVTVVAEPKDSTWGRRAVVETQMEIASN